MAKKIIFIDPGHGGSDPGACNGKRHEADDNLRLSLLIKAELEKQDATVILSRTTDIALSLAARTKAANNAGADYFLSIHRNSYSANSTGNEIWVINTATQNTINKAKSILDAICAVDRLTNRGVKKGAPGYTNFAVNRDTNMASALLEVSFISNSRDNLLYDAHIADYAKVIAKSLCENVGVAWKETERYSIRLIWDDADSELATYASVDEAIAACPALYSVWDMNGINLYTRWPGDVDGDGKISVSDARTALRVSVGLEVISDVDKTAADIDADGKITASDARTILRKAVGLE